jgi:paraquat-inducible protein A
MEFEACPECDLLLTKMNPIPGNKHHCPRCGFVLQRPHNHSIERTLALSLAGLVLMIPANLLPMLGIKLFGNSFDGNLWTGVMALFKEDMWEVAVLVMLSSVLLPFVNMALAGLISFHLHMKKANAHITRWMRWLQHLNEWAMLEVYALGIIVACVKLSDMAEIKFGLGLYAFIALIIINALLANELDYTLFWQHIARLKKK